ncbi:hypothetical protein M5011_11110, partial [Neisseria meningitidis]|nr:hypothetical protein [Neisseria meningitidis]
MELVYIYHGVTISWTRSDICLTTYWFSLPLCREVPSFPTPLFTFLFCGNNGILDDVHLLGKQKTLRRHSRESGNLDFWCGKIFAKKGFAGTWVSPLRGIKGCVFYQRKVQIYSCAGRAGFEGSC